MLGDQPYVQPCRLLPMQQVRHDLRTPRAERLRPPGGPGHLDERGGAQAGDRHRHRLAALDLPLQLRRRPAATRSASRWRPIPNLRRGEARWKAIRYLGTGKESAKLAQQSFAQGYEWVADLARQNEADLGGKPVARSRGRPPLRRGPAELRHPRRQRPGHPALRSPQLRRPAPCPPPSTTTRSRGCVRPRPSYDATSAAPTCPSPRDPPSSDRRRSTPPGCPTSSPVRCSPRRLRDRLRPATGSRHGADQPLLRHRGQAASQHRAVLEVLDLGLHASSLPPPEERRRHLRRPHARDQLCAERRGGRSTSSRTTCSWDVLRHRAGPQGPRGRHFLSARLLTEVLLTEADAFYVFDNTVQPPPRPGTQGRHPLRVLQRRPVPLPAERPGVDQGQGYEYASPERRAAPSGGRPRHCHRARRDGGAPPSLAP